MQQEAATNSKFCISVAKIIPKKSQKVQYKNAIEGQPKIKKSQQKTLILRFQLYWPCTHTYHQTHIPKEIFFNNQDVYFGMEDIF